MLLGFILQISTTISYKSSLLCVLLPSDSIFFISSSGMSSAMVDNGSAMVDKDSTLVDKDRIFPAV